MQSLEGLEGVVCMIDDILIYGRNQEEHDTRLAATMGRLEKCGITLNYEKCQFSMTSIKFLGHVVGKEGISSDLTTVKAILQMKDQSDIRRFLGMVNLLIKQVLTQHGRSQIPCARSLGRQTHGSGETTSYESNQDRTECGASVSNVRS